MKIIFLTTCFTHQYNRITDICNENRAKAIQSSGCSVTVIAPVSYSPKVRYLLPVIKPGSIIRHIREVHALPFYENISGMEIYRPKRITLPGKMFGIFDHKIIHFFNGKKIKKIIEKIQPDFILVSGLIPDSTYAIVLKKRFAVPVYSIFEGSDIMTAEKTYLNFKNIFPWLKQYIDKVIYVSESFKNDVEKKYVFNSSVVINNGFDSKIFFHSKTKMPEKAKVTRLLSVGGLLPVKNQGLLLRVLRLVSFSYHLTIIGKGSLQEELSAYIKNNNLNVTLLPQLLPQKKIKEHMDNADFFVMPSHSESFGIAVIEAMACGLPVIASHVGGLKDLIVPGFNGLFFDSNDEQGLKNALEKGVKTEWDSQKISQWAQENYSWKKWAEKVIGLKNDI